MDDRDNIKSNSAGKWQCAECRGWWPTERAACPFCAVDDRTPQRL